MAPYPQPVSALKKKNPFETKSMPANNLVTYDFSQAKSTPQTPKYDFSQAKSVPATTTVAKPAQTDYVSQFLKSTQDLGNRQKAQVAQRQAEDVNFLNKSYAKSNENLAGQIPQAQEGFNQFKTSQEQRVQRAKESLPFQEEQINTQFGEEQKQRAMTRRESEGRIKNMFAANNATDSYGAGSMTQELSGLENTFNTQTGSALQQRLGQIFSARRSVKDVEDEADSLVAQEQTKLNATIQQIRNAVGVNSLDKEKAIREAYRASQDKVNEIDDYLNNLQYTNAQEAAKAGVTNKGKVAAKDANIAQSGLTAISNIRNFISKNPNITKDINPLSNRDYKATITNTADLIGRLRSGGAIQAEEEKRFRSLLPTFLDSPQDVEYKLSQLEDEFNNLLGGGGQNELDQNTIAYLLSQL